MSTLFLELLLVEGELGSLKDGTIAASGLSGPRGDLGVETSAGHLVVDGVLEGASLLPGGHLPLDVGGLLLVLLLGGRSSLLDANLDTVVGLVPRLEGVGVDEDDGTLHESLGTDQLVVGGIVDHVEDTDLARAHLGTPGEVTGVEAEGAELLVASAGANLGDALLADLGHGGGAAHLELALLAELGATASRLAALVLSLACDSLGVGAARTNR